MAEEVLPGDEEVQTDPCFLAAIDEMLETEKAQFYEENPECDDASRGFFAKGRFIMADTFCKGNNPAEWCGSNGDNRREFNKLLNYGCNCYPKNRMPVGAGNHFRNPGFNGIPIDDLDAACETLSKRYRCTQHDFEDNCPYSTRYNHSWRQSENRVVCNKGTPCQRRLCEMDKSFANELLYVLGGKSPTQYVINENRRNRNAWSKVGKCVALSTPNPNLQCCGPEEERSPFNFNTQKCCDDEIFMENDPD